jgi:hypothetical protein
MGMSPEVHLRRQKQAARKLIHQKFRWPHIAEVNRPQIPSSSSRKSSGPETGTGGRLAPSLASLRGQQNPLFVLEKVGHMYNQTTPRYQTSVLSVKVCPTTGSLQADG